MSFGSYPALSLKEARELRDEARNLLAKGVNPHTERKRKRHAIVLAGEHTFQAIYDKWLAHRSLSLENEGRQSTPKQIGRIFANTAWLLAAWPCSLPAAPPKTPAKTAQPPAAKAQRAP